MSEASEARKTADALLAAAIVPEERELAEALIQITKKYGKFNEDDTGVWAGYETAAENENGSKGVKCENCILYRGGTECAIIAAEVEPGGYCRFALIPDGIVTKGRDERSSSEEPLFNCPVCAHGCGCSVGPCNCPPTCMCPCRTSVIIVSAASRPAPKKDRIYGSKRNKPGSADGTKTIVFSNKVEKALKNKVTEHNGKASADRQATLPMLKAVYRRGSGAFSSSHRPGKTRDQWAMARVNAFLRLLRTGRPANSNYVQDNDLLPKKHPRSTRGEMSITASAAAIDELQITLLPEEEYESPEHAIVAMAEYSGLGYDVIPALRAVWIRAVNDHDDPFERVREAAVLTYGSKDADLLPKV